MNETIPTPESDAAMEQTLSCTDHGSGYIRTVPLEVAQGLERRAVLAERERDSAVQSAKDSMRNFRSCDVKRIEAERERERAERDRDEVLRRVASVDAIIGANRVAALEAVRQWREVAERLDAWVHALAPRVESHPHEYDENLVHAVTEFDRLSRGQP